MSCSPKLTLWTPEYFAANRMHCNEILENADNVRDIPLLNTTCIHKLKDGQLVRFKGMIQDMRDPEYYFERYEVKNGQIDSTNIRCGMYMDSAKCLEHEEILLESQQNKMSERHTYVIISTPGLNEWVKFSYQEQLSCLTTGKAGNTKQGIRNSDTCSECSGLIQKRVKFEEEDLLREFMLNFPIPVENGKACIVKVYEQTLVKLNETVDVIGFLSLNPVPHAVSDVEETMSHTEMIVHHPPASLIPRLHAVRIIRTPSYVVVSAPQITSKAELIRSDLHLMLSQFLFGDHFAADYLICHLLSSNYARRDDLCLGNFPLNLTHFPFNKYKEFPANLYKLLAQLTEKSHLLKITLNNLEKFTLSPKKDYEANRLNSGVLQLSDHTHLVIDETEVNAGQITQVAQQNYRILCDLVNFQKISYDFQFYTMQYDTDLPVLILSEAKSFVQCQTQVVIQVDSEAENIHSQILEITEQFLKDENRLANIRAYLRFFRDEKFSYTDEDVLEEIQNDFVRSTVINRNPDRLHMLMVLVRLLSLSYGSTTLTAEHWRKATLMESERHRRLNKK